VSPVSQILGLFIGGLVSALLTQLINQVKGMREDMREHAKRQDRMAQKQDEMHERLTTLEAEHRMGCMHQAAQTQPMRAGGRA